MRTIFECSVGNRPLEWELKKSPRFVGHPQFVRYHVEFPHTEMRGVRCECNALLEFMQPPLLLQQIGNIYTGTDIAPKISMHTKTWRSAARTEAIFTILTPDAILHRERFTCIERRYVCLHTILEVIEVDSF